MDFSKLELLTQVRIEKPCLEDWDEMSGDEQNRHCAGCGCCVHNVAEMSAIDAESLLSRPERVCARFTVDAKQNVLTRDGWIPRLLLAGAIAATATGCAPTKTSLATSTGSTATPSQFELVEDQIVGFCDDAIDTLFPSLRPPQVVSGWISFRATSSSSLPPPKL